MTELITKSGKSTYKHRSLRIGTILSKSTFFQSTSISFNYLQQERIQINRQYSELKLQSQAGIIVVKIQEFINIHLMDSILIYDLMAVFLSLKDFCLKLTIEFVERCRLDGILPYAKPKNLQTSHTAVREIIKSEFSIPKFLTRSVPILRYIKSVIP